MVELFTVVMRVERVAKRVSRSKRGVRGRPVLGPRFFVVARPAEKLEVARRELAPVKGGSAHRARGVVRVSLGNDAVELEVLAPAAARARIAQECAQVQLGLPRPNNLT